MMVDGMVPGIMLCQCPFPNGTTTCAKQQMVYPTGVNEYASDHRRPAVHVLTGTASPPPG